MIKPEHRSVLRLNPLFQGMDDAELDEELRFYRARRESYVKGDTLLRVGAPVERFALVLSGSVQVMSDDINGHHMIMITVQPGQSFAESLCFQMEQEKGGMNPFSLNNQTPRTIAGSIFCFLLISLPVFFFSISSEGWGV